MKWFILIFVGIGGMRRAAILPGVAPVYSVDSTTCGATTDFLARQILHELRLVVSTPAGASERTRYQLPFIQDTLNVRPVANDSLCQVAGRRVNEWNGAPLDAKRSPYVIRIDTLYWVQDRSLTSSEFIPVYVLDIDMTKVLLKSSR